MSNGSARRNEQIKLGEPVTPSSKAVGRTRSWAVPGIVSVGLAKVWFLVSGFALTLALPVVLGLTQYGAFKRAVAVVSLVNNVIVLATVQAVSRTWASRTRETSLLRLTAIHGLLGLTLSVVILVTGSWLLRLLKAEHLGTHLHILAPLPLLYSLYAVAVGVLNGQQRFGIQASLDVAYSTLRTGLVLFLGSSLVISLGAVGSALGFASAAVLIAPIAFLVVWRGIRAEEPPLVTLTDKKTGHLTGFVTLLALQLFQTVLLQADVLILGHNSYVNQMMLGSTIEAAHVLADYQVGRYAQAHSIGLVPFQVLLAASSVLFPAVAQAKAQGDEGKLRSTIQHGGRLTTLAAGALVATIAASPKAVLTVAFGTEASLSSGVLAILAIAYGLLAIASLSGVLLAAARNTRAALWSSAIVASCGLIGTWIGAAPWGGGIATSAPIATTMAVGLCIGVAVGCIASLLMVRSVLGSLVPLNTAIRVMIALGTAMAIGYQVPVPTQRFAAILCCPLGLLIYLLILWVMGERFKPLRNP